PSCAATPSARYACSASPTSPKPPAGHATTSPTRSSPSVSHNENAVSPGDWPRSSLMPEKPVATAVRSFAAPLWGSTPELTGAAQGSLAEGTAWVSVKFATARLTGQAPLGRRSRAVRTVTAARATLTYPVLLEY